MTPDFDRLPLWKQMELLTRLRFVAAVVAVSEVAASLNSEVSPVAMPVCAECEHGGDCTIPQQCRLNLPSLISTN